VPALKELLCRGGFRHRWPLAPQGQLFKFAPEPNKEPALKGEPAVVVLPEALAVGVTKRKGDQF
jgi:hypothetical protein